MSTDCEEAKPDDSKSHAEMLVDINRKAMEDAVMRDAAGD
jgi:hypothetical protein